VGNLWTASGTLLARATFTNETDSGWQQFDLPTPVTLTPGTTYVVSYHTDGNYSEDDNYFTSNAKQRAAHCASRLGEWRQRRLAYGSSSSFPSSSYLFSNYWGDLVFTPSP
jgi:hypothetical protein